MNDTLDVVAEYLGRENPVLREGEYVLRERVALSCVLRKGSPLEGEGTLDLLVCRGDRIVLGIACSWDSQLLFRDRMKGLSWVRLTDEEDGLPFDEDGGLPSPGALFRLDELVSKMLSGGSERGGGLMSYRRRQMGQEPGDAGGYTLPAMPLECLIPEAAETKEALHNRLIRCRLLERNGALTPYGTSLGLFLEEGAEGIDRLRVRLMSTAARKEMLKQALGYPVGRQKRTGLKERLSRLHHDLPAAEEWGQAALEQLLNAPLEQLYRNHPGGLTRLKRTLSREELRSRGPVKTYCDGLRLACMLRREFGDDYWEDSSRAAESRKLFQTMLLALSEPFLLQRAEPDRKSHGKRISLAQRLEALPEDTWRRYPAFRMPLCQYYQAACSLTGSGYPQWLYNQKIRVLFAHDTRPETAFDLMTLVLHCHNLHGDETVDDWDETFPLLYDLLVDPIISPEWEDMERMVQ